MARHFGRWVVAGLLAIGPLTVYGQAAKTFDVASVKPSAPLDPAKLQADMRAGRMPNFGAHLDGLRAEYNYMTLKALIIYAYKLRPYQVSGPDWLASEHFDIVARLPEGSTKDDAPAMLRTLLEDRFKLKAHLENKELPVYTLVVGKDGPKLKDSPAPPPIDESAPLKPGEMKMDLPDGPAIISGMTTGQSTVNMGTRGLFHQKIDLASQSVDIDGQGVTMTGFADLLSQVMQIGGSDTRQVVDQTGLKGHYEVAVDISLGSLMAAARTRGDGPGGPPPPPGGGAGPGAGAGPGGSVAEASDPGGAGGGASIFESVQKLGLKLEPGKAPVQQLVVDSAEKAPTAD